MQKSGIDVNLFKPHSTRAASTSKAFLKSVPLEHILSVAGWSSSDTFAKFYKKPLINTDSFSTVLLQETGLAMKHVFWCLVFLFMCAVCFEVSREPSVR